MSATGAAAVAGAASHIVITKSPQDTIGNKLLCLVPIIGPFASLYIQTSIAQELQRQDLSTDQGRVTVVARLGLKNEIKAYTMIGEIIAVAAILTIAILGIVHQPHFRPVAYVASAIILLATAYEGYCINYNRNSVASIRNGATIGSFR